MKVKDFMQEHEHEFVHLHWEGSSPDFCCEWDAYSTNQNLAITHGEDEIAKWEYRQEWHYDRYGNYILMQVPYVTIV